MNTTDVDFRGVGFEVWNG